MAAQLGSAPVAECESTKPLARRAGLPLAMAQLELPGNRGSPQVMAIGLPVGLLVELGTGCTPQLVAAVVVRQRQRSPVGLAELDTLRRSRRQKAWTCLKVKDIFNA